MVSYEHWLVELGRNLQGHRQQREWTQASAAECCGLDLKYYQDVEYGRRPVTTRTLFRIADAMGIDIAELVPSSVVPLRRGRRSVIRESSRGRGAVAQGESSERERDGQPAGGVLMAEGGE
ncbi:MAG: XRE family transcriptional regulator [Deltaproteobacteria bacterium]|nr:MAG: XRE family transcriptional regulator [Deltaproteobacteria bacterium]